MATEEKQKKYIKVYLFRHLNSEFFIGSDLKQH